MTRYAVHNMNQDQDMYQQETWAPLPDLGKLNTQQKIKARSLDLVPLFIYLGWEWFSSL
jgi:hypothetical protein